MTIRSTGGVVSHDRHSEERTAGVCSSSWRAVRIDEGPLSNRGERTQESLHREAEVKVMKRPNLRTHRYGTEIGASKPRVWVLVSLFVAPVLLNCGESDDGADPSSVGGQSQIGGASVGGSGGRSFLSSAPGSAIGGIKSTGVGSSSSATSVTGNGGQSSVGGTSSSPNGGFRIIGYEESSTGNNLDRIQFDKLTHINYAFGLPKTDGSLEPVPNETKLDALVKRAHDGGVTVSLSIGGWNNGDDSAITAVAASPTARTRFAEAVFDYADEHDLDGIDIDWEYPASTEAANFTALVAELSNRFRPANKLVTVAAGGGAWIASGITQPSYQYLDYIMIMSYDDSGSTNHSSYEYAKSGLDLFLDTKGVPKSKVVLGVPFYSHPSYRSYSAIVGENPAAAQVDEFNGQNYNGIPTIRAKTELAMDRGSGIMIWELSQDTNNDLSLLNAIYSVVHQ
jgi:GH18 family chitinase